VPARRRRALLARAARAAAALARGASPLPLPDILVE